VGTDEVVADADALVNAFKVMALFGDDKQPKIRSRGIKQAFVDNGRNVLAACSAIHTLRVLRRIKVLKPGVYSLTDRKRA
jgi:hypothetical protein